MQPTKRLISIGLIGISITALAYLINTHILVFLLYNIGLIVAIIVDYKASNFIFEVERVHDEKLSLYADEHIGFRVYNKSNQLLTIKLKDTMRDFIFDKIKDTASGVIKPHEKETLYYVIRPKKRGIHELGKVYVAFLSRYKLIYIFRKYDMPESIKVYPNLKDLRKYRLMIYNGHLMRGGKKQWNNRGEGLEFESLREYISGDPYSKINWRATAKENKPIVNQYEIEKNQDVIAIIDAGRAMSYEVKGYKKLDLAINTSLILSDIVNATGDKSGLLVFNREVLQYVKPSRGPTHRNMLMESLYTIDYSLETSNFSEAFNHLAHYQKKRSILCIFTEFETMDEAEEYLKILPLISRRHLVMIFMMTKEKVIDLTIGEKKTEKDLFIKGAAYDILNERRIIIKRLRKSGIMCVECTPDTLTTEVINQYIVMKHKSKTS